VEIIEAEKHRVLATQTPDALPGSFEDSVNRQARMTVILFDGLQERILLGCG